MPELCPLVSPDAAPGRCRWCGGALTGRQTSWCGPACTRAFGANHWWTDARAAALKRDHQRCVRCGSPIAPEVNHIEPRNGAGYGPGCHHHQANLETLCHACHVLETTRQIRERRGIPPEGWPAPEPVDRFPGARPMPMWPD